MKKNPITLTFEVRRVRTSVTQQEAHVYCNGEYITNFGDVPELIKPGEKYFGTMVAGYASKTPDAKFVHATMFHKYDDLYHISDGVQKIIDNIMELEIKTAERMYEE